MRRFIVRVTQDRFTVSCGVVVTNSAGEVLLLDHRVRPGSGWGLPGGFLEFGEQPHDGARREIREETGLELQDLKLVRARTSRTHIEIIFRAASDGVVKLETSEIKDFGWFALSDLPKGMDPVHRKYIEGVLDDAFEKSQSSY